MIYTADVKKEMVIKLDSQTWVVIEIQFVSPGKGPAFYRMKLKNLRSGNMVERTFKSGDQFEEANVDKIKAKFVYSHRGGFVFSWENDPSKRFELSESSLGNTAKFLKQNQIVDGVTLDGEVINISLPIKVFLKVKDAPPGVKGDRAQGGTKTVTLETGATIEAPLFVESGDVLEINTETGEYVRRAEQ